MTEQPLLIMSVQALIEAMENSSVGELELLQGGTRIQIKRASAITPTVLAPPPGSLTAFQIPPLLYNGPGQPAMGAAPAAPAPGKSGAPARRAEESGVAIVSPLTGVYYSAASPTSDPFVKVGEVVQEGQVVAIVEAMKVFNEVKSEVAGTVISIPAQNGQLVQKGDALVRVQPA